MKGYGETKMNATCACPKDQQIHLWSSQGSIALSLGTGVKRKETDGTKN